MSCLALVGILLKEGRPYILQIVQVELKQTKNEKRKSSHGCCSWVLFQGSTYFQTLFERLL